MHALCNLMELFSPPIERELGQAVANEHSASDPAMRSNSASSSALNESIAWGPTMGINRYVQRALESESTARMASIARTPQERRILYLKLAAEAEITAAKLRDPKVKAAWIDLTVSWMMMASEIPAENERRQRK